MGSGRHPSAFHFICFFYPELQNPSLFTTQAAYAETMRRVQLVAIVAAIALVIWIFYSFAVFRSASAGQSSTDNAVDARIAALEKSQRRMKDDIRKIWNMLQKSAPVDAGRDPKEDAPASDTSVKKRRPDPVDDNTGDSTGDSPATLQNTVIVVLTYNRPDYLKRTLSRVLECGSIRKFARIGSDMVMQVFR
jgi:hypothetical protein